MPAKPRIPQQQRSLDTRERLLAAARQLFAEEGYHAANTKRIAARAGVAVGSFYAYFRDKKEIFLAALSDYNRRIAARIEPPRPESEVLADKRAYIEAYIRRIMDAHKLDPAFHRQALLLQQTDAQVKQAVAAQEREQRAAAFAHLAVWRDQIRVRDLEAAASVLFGAVEAAAHAAALGKTEIEEERLVAALAEMIERDLFPDEG